MEDYREEVFYKGVEWNGFRAVFFFINWTYS